MVAEDRFGQSLGPAFRANPLCFFHLGAANHAEVSLQGKVFSALKTFVEFENLVSAGRTKTGFKRHLGIALRTFEFLAAGS